MTFFLSALTFLLLAALILLGGIACFLLWYALASFALMVLGRSRRTLQPSGTLNIVLSAVMAATALPFTVHLVALHLPISVIGRIVNP